MTINTVASAPTTLQNSSLGMEDFLKILTTQLTYQDPLKPMDNQEFMAQMAQFSALEENQQINDKMALLVTNQASLQSVGLIGRTVDLSNADGTTATGTVSALSLTGDTPSLTVTTTAGATLSNVSLSQVTAVR